MPTIKKPNQHFDATLWTGNGSSQSITNAGGFQPDFVWIKNRSAGYGNLLFDAIRGATNWLSSNDTGAEATTSNSLTSFNSNGFSIGDWVVQSNNGNNIVGWQWKAGGASTVNTSGTISSNVSVNTTAGFSVVTYTGNGSSGNIGHGLGVAPKIVLVKNRTTGATQWVFFTSIVDGSWDYLLLNSTAAKDNAGETAPTSTTFNVASSSSSINTNGDNYVAYCWAEVEGYSKFGSYTGNNSTDGPFQYTGFRPRFIMIKASSGSSSWTIQDASRDAYNLGTRRIYADLGDVEDTTGNIDYLSNGFKLRGGAVNGNGTTFIYMAFAEAPFKFSNAR